MELCRDKSNAEIVYRMLKQLYLKPITSLIEYQKAFNPI